MRVEQRILVGVIGAGRATPGGYARAREVGRLIAERGAAVVCGGLGGIMEAVCRGCAEAGGTAVGILPGGEASAANRYVGLAIPTNLGHARNVVIAHS
ncbi:MAG: TIGR00725 family protein, partial [Desulfuromonadales bacterium]